MRLTLTSVLCLAWVIGVSATAGIADVFSAKITSTASFDWSNKVTDTSSAGQSQSASFTIGGPAYGYAGPTRVLVYWDDIYHSFVFAFPTTPAAASGTISDVDGAAIANKPVALVLGTKTLKTVTDGNGKFEFYGVPAGPAKVVVDGKPHAITISAGDPGTQIKISP